MQLLLSWLISAGAIWLTAELLPGFEVKGFKGALIVAALLGFLNATLGLVMKAVIGFGTLGLGFVLMPLTTLVVMTLLLVLTDKLADSLKIRSFGNAAVGALVITIVSTAAHAVI